LIAFDYNSALLAQENGADRLEICDNKLEGCTTPSYGLVKLIKEAIQIPIFPMIRPRGGDFLYSKEEIHIMKYDIELFRDIGCEGVVFGCLDEVGNVDVKRCEELLKIAYPMKVTFRRAFDRSNDPFNALRDISSMGFSRILTSGQKPTALEGKELIKELISRSEGDIIIIPGGGINSTNIVEVFQFTGAQEIHSPATIQKKSNMEFVNLELKENLEFYGLDEKEARRMKQLLGARENY